VPDNEKILESNVYEMEKQNRELMIRISELVAEKSALEKRLEKEKKRFSNEYDDQMMHDMD
jgi:phage shock protein A|tara:strand:- start:17733 stop:17915 length:183 start_codon:yes stop_codon:yes gene_type:complete